MCKETYIYEKRPIYVHSSSAIPLYMSINKSLSQVSFHVLRFPFISFGLLFYVQVSFHICKSLFTYFGLCSRAREHSTGFFFHLYSPFLCIGIERRDLYIWKETYTYEKRPIHTKRDLYISLFLYIGLFLRKNEENPTKSHRNSPAFAQRGDGFYRK